MESLCPAKESLDRGSGFLVSSISGAALNSNQSLRAVPLANDVKKHAEVYAIADSTIDDNYILASSLSRNMGPFANIKKSRSFSAVQGGGNATLQHNADADDKTMSSLVNEQTAEDLQETITALRQSIATHANANAETLEHFTTLKKAHDTLYSEHLSLQEQMDDAVELLKYLKEEKCSNETKIKELGTEIGVLRESASGKVGGGVVSLTIENLTREKMELEEALKVMEEDRQEAVNNIEQYELERKEIADRLDEFGLDGTQEEGLTRNLALLYEQASSQKEQIRKLEEQ